VAYGPANTPLILSGWNFGSSGTVIFTAYKNGAVDPNVPPVNATVTQWTAGKLTLTVPANAYTGTIKVTSGGMTSNALPFMVTRNSYSSSCPQLPPAQETTPAVASLTPPSGSAGLAVNISGSAFGAVQGQGYVTFNGAVATVLRWSDSSITAIVPGNPATGPVVVTLEGGQTSNNNVIFTVNAALCTPL
jgi:autotransporter-associated beta strand protein